MKEKVFIKPFLNNMKFYLRTFGCQMNDADSEVMKRLLEREGCGKVDSPEGVDVIILNKNN